MKKFKKYYLVFVCLFILSGCVTTKPFTLSETALEDRQMQSRSFETKDEKSILVASLNVLQDLGFNIDETEKKLGLLTCSKLSDASNTGELMLLGILGVLGNNPNAINEADGDQYVNASLVIRKSKQNKKEYVARITFQKMVYNQLGNVKRLETIDDPDLYKEFFGKLSQSLFLEANKI